MQQLHHSRKGVSAAVIVIVAVVIVAIAGVAGYFLLTQPTSVTTQTNGSYPQSSTSAMMSETSAMSETSGATTAATSVNPLYLPSNSTQVFKLFSAMTIQLSSTTSSSNQPEVFNLDFKKVGTAVVNGVQTTKYNFTYSGSTGSNSTITLFYADNGTVISASVGGTMLNGTNAHIIAAGALDIFNLFLGYNGYFQNPAYYSELTPTGTSSQTFGQVTMQVTSYTASAVNFAGNQYGSVQVSIGKLPGSSFSMVVYFKATGTTAQGTGTGTYQLISATPA